MINKIIDKVQRYFIRRHYKEILSIIKEAKEYYMTKVMFTYLGMCECFCKALSKHKNVNMDLNLLIPEYSRRFLNATYKDRGYWWDVSDVRSRIEAFDILIKIYETKVAQVYY